MTDHMKMLHAITEHDRRQERKKYYNRYALAQYAAALEKVEKHTAQGASLRDAIITCFCGILADKLLKSVGLPIMTDSEARHGLTKPLAELPDDDEIPG